MEGDRLIAAGLDPLRVFAAGEQDIQIPFVVHVLPADPLALRVRLVRMPVSLEVDTSHHYAEATDGISVRSRSVSGGNRSNSWPSWIQAPHIASSSSQRTCSCAKCALNRNFLDCSGRLNRLRVVIAGYDRTLFLSPYQS